jgi:rRNA processing protein Gar1
LSRRVEGGERRLRTIGTIVAVTPTGSVTVRAAGSEVPSEGTFVSDTGGRLQGRISRVFGPVARPYLSVRLRQPPSPRDGAALVGGTVVERS